jgi:hypothetical protein
LGQIVSQDGLLVDPKKVVAMQDCPHTKMLESLPGFLGLIGYYKNFVKNCGNFVIPLTLLLKENSFIWSEVVEQAFLALKDAMCTTLVLTVSDFTKNFVLECNASSRDLGVVLMQEGHHLAFTSK